MKSLTQRSHLPSPAMRELAPRWRGYLVGKPQVEAPTPLAVIVQRVSGSDQLVNELAQPVIYRHRWQDDEDIEEDNAKAAIRAQIASELAARVEEK